MNVLLLVTIAITLALVHGQNQHPCERNYNNNAYNTFVQRHILQESFDRQSATEWRGYLQTYGLCNRPTQSFIRKRDRRRVLQTCNGSGRRDQGNLCISGSRMLVYNVRVDISSCNIQSLVRGMKYVVVACDRIENRCLPVHFERYTNQRPDNRAQRCRP